MEPETGDLVCRACWGPTDVTGLRLPKGQGIVWRAVNRNATELVKDTSDDPDFSHKVDANTGFITRSVLCAPMSVRDERLGAIELFNKKGGGSFDGDDRRVLQALAASAALALINARQAAAMAEQQVLKRELALAAWPPISSAPCCRRHGHRNFPFTASIWRHAGCRATFSTWSS
ncbi:MAG: sigma-B regulation protein RsbU [Rhodospirillaceae bacterium]|nr:MAG: sigma-B regulation protein RsbU [Rhodospirillaceae bacterium]